MGWYSRTVLVNASMGRVRFSKWTRWLLFGMLLSVALPGLGANRRWFARTWQSDDDLPDNNVTGIGPTADGYPWIATTAGLVRFDGVQLQKYTPFQLPNAPGRVITALIVDRRHRLWMATARGPVTCRDTTSAHGRTLFFEGPWP